MVCFALFMFGMMYMVFHMLDNMQKENYEKTTEMLLRQAEKKDKEHVERYYKNLKRLPEIQLQI